MPQQSQETPTPAQRREMIAVAAYYLAERRAFSPGGEEADWICAERTIDEMIANRQLSQGLSPDARRTIIRNALVMP